MRVAQKKVYDASDVAALNAVATRSGRNKSFRLAITVFGLIDLAAAAGAWYLGKEPWAFLVCGVAMIVLANVIVPLITRASARKANGLLLGRFVRVIAENDGVTVDSNLGTRRLDWPYCKATYDLEKHVALLFGERSAVVLEKRPLNDEQIAWLLSKGGTE